MGRHSRGFTLIELLVVMVIIIALIAIFVPQIPAILNWYRVHLCQVYMQQLEFGIAEYRRVYGDYPYSLAKMTNDGKRLLDGENHGKGGWTDPNVCHYGNTQGSLSLFLMLQGPDGAGWTPDKNSPGVKEFGPIPESPGFVGLEFVNTQWSPTAWGVVDAHGMRVRRRFEDPFGRPILYYKARLDSRYQDISSSPYGSQLRYDPTHNQGAWTDGTAQRGADETQFGGGYFYMYRAENWGRHWRKKLTASMVGVTRYPHNPKTYVIWMAGADARFGYWSWSEEHSGYVVDEDPEGTADGIIGRCDDIANFAD